MNERRVVNEAVHVINRRLALSVTIHVTRCAFRHSMPDRFEITLICLWKKHLQ
jgi:hypothetical protein